MKKLVLGCLFALGILVVLIACSKQKDDEATTTPAASGSGSGGSTDTVELINGVKWATRNVDAPSHFATNSYDGGMLYQWNSKSGWPTTGAIGSITATDGSKTWNSTWKGGYTKPTSSDVWIVTNDPSPAGWRVPTYLEIKTLLDTTKVSNIWTAQNGVNGRKFTDKSNGNSIFLPAVGSRDGGSIYLEDGGLYGTYWCSTAIYTYGEADNLTFDATDRGGNNSATRAEAYSIRSVVK